MAWTFVDILRPFLVVVGKKTTFVSTDISLSLYKLSLDKVDFF
jgi:hypothetical protein